jgi:class 3 adenylate cyclase
VKTSISSFKPTASYPQKAVVMIFDLEGFSNFFSQPDVQEYVPKFLNIILDAVDSVINGGDGYWRTGAKDLVALPKPIHSKFLGDGALYIWRYNDFEYDELITLVNRLYILRLRFSKILLKAAEVVPVIDMPKNIRFGIAAGSVYKLTYKDSNKEEFIGYSINLASRLQSYCRDIGFIVSARLNIKSAELEKDRYLKKVAKNLQGFPKEYVLIDTDDYNGLSDELKADLFE